MVALLLEEESLRSEGDNEKKRKLLKRSEIQCMINFYKECLLLIGLKIVLKKAGIITKI
jgi:hypothetical protein